MADQNGRMVFLGRWVKDGGATRRKSKGKVGHFPYFPFIH